MAPHHAAARAELTLTTAPRHRAATPRLLRVNAAHAVLVAILAAMVAAVALLPVAWADASGPSDTLEEYAGYQPQTRCSPQAKPGTEYLATWIVKRYGGGYGGISRACGGSGSEHKEGRAFDWMVDAGNADDRARVERLLEKLFAADKAGNPHAMARRMGIMYIIWDDQMYASYDHFAPKPYLHSGCKRLARCSATLRHRDHVHISLTRAGGRGDTSWYERRLELDRTRPERLAAAKAEAVEARKAYWAARREARNLELARRDYLQGAF